MFDPKLDLNSTHVHKSNPNGNWGTMNFVSRVQKTPQTNENYRNWDGGGVQFRAETTGEDSGVCSPPLWKSSPIRSPVHARYPRNDHGFMSPNSRSQAIAKGQWELMEMVKNMPESCYELSLKDLVDPPRLEEECLVEEKSIGREMENQRATEIKKQESSKGKMVIGNRRVENRGLLLKMVFPIGFRSSSKKKKNPGTNIYSRVSPKPEASEKSAKPQVDKEWWRKRFSSSSGSESGGGSSNSGSTGSSGSRESSSSCSNSRRRHGCSPGCKSFFIFRKNKKNPK